MAALQRQAGTTTNGHDTATKQNARRQKLSEPERYARQRAMTKPDVRRAIYAERTQTERLVQLVRTLETN